MSNCRAILCIMALVLASCSQNFNKLEKSAPQQVDRKSLIHPPWEALEKAGPGAENDFDLETLNGPQEALQTDVLLVPAPPSNSPQQQPPAPDAAKIDSIAVLTVRGASKLGAGELTKAMRNVLESAGWPIATSASPNALTLQGVVKLAKPQGDLQAVTIIWIVLSPKGKQLGQVEQNNDIPARSLDGAWGQTADDIAGAASEGIFKLINNLR